jgi:hypothetical protein
MRWVNLVFPVVVILGLLVFACLYFFTNTFNAVD